MNNRAINEFIKAVTKDMGWRQRAEMKRELRAHILDSAEALAAERKVPIDEAIVKEVIARMGSPAEIAAMYPVNRNSFLLEKIIVGCIELIVGFALVSLLTIGCAYILWIRFAV